MCTSQATINVLLDGPLDPMGARWDGQKANMFRYIQNKNMYIYKTSELAERQFSAETETKWLEARQVMQSANCVPAGRLKMYKWIALLNLL